jgi:hypothetical protein
MNQAEDSSPARVLRKIGLATPSFEKIAPARQCNSPQARVADSSSIKAVSFSSACTTKRFPSSRCASAIHIVRLLESIAETQPQLQPALLRLSAMISEYFMRTMSDNLSRMCRGAQTRGRVQRVVSDCPLFPLPLSRRAVACKR